MTSRYGRRHLMIGWWSVLGFLSLGIGLEWLHASKANWYLNEAFETRRHLWTLAHVHGAVLGLVHIAFSAALGWMPRLNLTRIQLASLALTGAGVLMPFGFALGGIALSGRDPGRLILLVPLGGVLLLVAVFVTAREVGAAAS